MSRLLSELFPGFPCSAPYQWEFYFLSSLDVCLLRIGQRSTRGNPRYFLTLTLDNALEATYILTVILALTGQSLPVMIPASLRPLSLGSCSHLTAGFWALITLPVSSVHLGQHLLAVVSFSVSYCFLFSHSASPSLI